MIKIEIRIYVIFFCILLIACAINILGAGYYRLLEKERKLYLGLRSIDSVAADKYLTLSAATERKYYYDQYWQGRDDEREKFEERTEYAFKEFGRYAPLSDERIPIYVKYGNPTKRYIITPEKKVGVITKEYVRPAEIWTYISEGIEFDFVRLTRAYKVIARSQFGERVILPILKEDTTSIDLSDTIPSGKLEFDVAFCRFKQRKDLVRLEIYTQFLIDDTAGCHILRRVKIYDESENLITKKNSNLIPINAAKGFFFDEINLWLAPQNYRVLVEYINLRSKCGGRKEFSVNLIDYKDDAKKVSDLVFAKLIDESSIEEKFYKPVGRVIPLVQPTLAVSTPFYVYHELYNLMTRDGQHLLKVNYEIYNREKMRKEIVDIMTQTESSEGDVAYIAAKYHPMDLPAGNYLIVARTTDLLSGEEYTAVGEFTLEKVK